MTAYLLDTHVVLWLVGEPERVPRRVRDELADLVADELAVSARHALTAGSLAWEHRDPFDRMLAAQATTENVALVTADAAMRGFRGLRTRWS